MDQGFKSHIRGLLDTGHRHAEMSQMLSCVYCGNRFKNAEKLYNRLHKERPELFQRQPEEIPDSPEMDRLEQGLDDRIKHDSAYHNHLKTLWKGTPEEKMREVKRFWNGFYERNTGDWRRKTL